MVRNRFLIRFHKEGDLRLISHHDLLRLFERLFRRAEIPLRCSEGFHPRALLNFPSALALGVAARDEALECELTAPLSADALAERMRAHAPAGLAIASVVPLDPAAGKIQAERATYELAIPTERQAGLAEAVARLLARPNLCIQREGRSASLDVREGLVSLEFVGGTLRMVLRVGSQTNPKPREILAELGLDDLLDAGEFLTRTRVELAS